LPQTIKAANASPPVEIVIVDYNSPDDLGEYIRSIEVSEPGNVLSYVRYTERDYYHMAHARNLSVKVAKGEYIVILSADIYPTEEYLDVVLTRIAKGVVWMHDRRYTGVICCQRQEFLEAGGYDERFEFYGPEDTDLDARLQRRGGEFAFLPNGLLGVIETPNEEKVKNYRLQLSKGEMHRRMKPIYEQNVRNGVLVANEGVEWGQM
jgi:hypothetical protein